LIIAVRQKFQHKKSRNVLAVRRVCKLISIPAGDFGKRQIELTHKFNSIQKLMRQDMHIGMVAPHPSRAALRRA
jgi:hypothetical protein